MCGVMENRIGSGFCCSPLPSALVESKSITDRGPTPSVHNADVEPFRRLHILGKDPSPCNLRRDYAAPAPRMPAKKRTQAIVILKTP